jgi:hypothetical protein
MRSARTMPCPSRTAAPSASGPALSRSCPYWRRVSSSRYHTPPSGPSSTSCRGRKPHPHHYPCRDPAHSGPGGFPPAHMARLCDPFPRNRCETGDVGRRKRRQLGAPFPQCARLGMILATQRMDPPLSGSCRPAARSARRTRSSWRPRAGTCAGLTRYSRLRVLRPEFHRATAYQDTVAAVRFAG